MLIMASPEIHFLKAESYEMGYGVATVSYTHLDVYKRQKDILIHDAHCMDNTLQLKLALMEGPDFPIALGVIPVSYTHLDVYKRQI